MRALVLVLALVTAGCGYALAGRGSFLPSYIQTIGVPLFTNSTPYFEVEQTLTERVRSELIGRGSYTVLPQTTGVDAVLAGQIVRITIEPASFTQEQQASRYVISLTAKIALRDLKTSKVIWENPSLVFREEYELVSGLDLQDSTAFFGQNSNAVQRLAEDFARSVVSAMLEAF